MSKREVEPTRSGLDSSPPSHTPATSAAPDDSATSIDIGRCVGVYNSMMDSLYPLELVASAVLYIVRWENYFLTLAILFLLCMLFYYPAFLAGSVVGSAIVSMAVGRYYSQTKLNTLLKQREKPQVQYLNEDDQALRRCNKDQKAAHRLLLEYRRIMHKTEAAVILTTKTLDYVYKIILWKSLEVSLCVTVLLCVLFTLLCTVYLRVLSASLPLIILCFNKHFIRRTVEIWTSIFGYLYTIKVKLKRKQKAETEVAVAKDSDNTEVVHHHEEPPTQDNTTEAELEDGRLGSESRQVSAAAQGLVNGGLGANGTDLSAAEGSALLNSKGFCNKCKTSFAKLLKRKHDCNYCGQTFCGSCTVKVKRAMLGATSPAAFEESVRVCLDCKHLLTT